MGVWALKLSGILLRLVAMQKLLITVYFVKQ